MKYSMDCLTGNSWDLERAVANFEAVKVRWSHDVPVVRYADPIWLVGPGNVAQGGLHITSGEFFWECADVLGKLRVVVPCENN